MDRLYFDYNATAPLADSFLADLCKYQIPFANPSATHSFGREARSLINETTDYIKKLLVVPDFKIFYHSGASEGINTFFNLTSSDVMAYFVSDHPVIHAIANEKMKAGHTIIQLPIEKNGDFDFKLILAKLLPHKDKNIFINFTYVHNETGYINSLEKIAKLKDFLSCLIHIDAAQAVGRFENWNHLSSVIDVYTFSGHKFGALKGVGFSCFNPSFRMRPLILGGGQQGELRGGTENLTGIVSMKYALEQMINNVNYEILKHRKFQLENVLSDALVNKGQIVLADSPRALNTTLIALDGHKGEFAQIMFDMEGIAVSFGSACSSGTSKGSQTMIGLGLEKWQHNIVRLSYCPVMMSTIKAFEFEQIVENIANVVNKL